MHINLLGMHILYHNLQKSDFIALLEYLSGSYVGLESRRVYGKIWYDEKEGTFGRRGRYTKIKILS